ncbi:hypothetical protein R3I93_016879 [Phoxinus phoxinus]|uniref:Ig-like domain-containing protein n=1 Tax=Phoxinus phoxinus TaxID=58324 RepID=A0AAN9CH55_9TELE
MEGVSVTLNTDVTEIPEDEDILWKYGAENSLIARISKTDAVFSTYEDVPDGRFRDRLKLDDQTGSLTITHTTTEHTGVYKLEISGAKRSSKTFNVSVYARLPVPVIIRNSSHCSSSSSSSCSLVEYQDKNTYSCVLNNPISNQTTHLDIHTLCHTCAGTAEGHAPCCDSVESVLRLVVTALMGVASAAAAVLLVNDVRAARG